MMAYERTSKAPFQKNFYQIWKVIYHSPSLLKNAGLAGPIPDFDHFSCQNGIKTNLVYHQVILSTKATFEQRFQ